MAQKIKKFSRPKRLTSPRAAHIWATLHAAPPFSPSLPSSHHPPSPRPPPNLPLRVTGVPAIPPAPSPLIPMPQLPRYVPSVSRPHWAPALARCPPDPLAPSPQPLVYRPAHGTSTAPQSSICLQKPRCPLSCPPQSLPSPWSPLVRPASNVFTQAGHVRSCPLIYPQRVTRHKDRSQCKSTKIPFPTNRFVWEIDQISLAPPKECVRIRVLVALRGFGVPKCLRSGGTIKPLPDDPPYSGQQRQVPAPGVSEKAA
jgi:hypothetical protein